MEMNINQILDNLYDNVASQLQLINELRKQFNGTEIVSINKGAVEQPVSVGSPTTSPALVSNPSANTASRKLTSTRYATRSYSISGKQAFKNPSEDSTDKYFKLSIYSDRTFTFDLCNITASALQTIKDNNLLSDEVASLDGNISIGSSLKVNIPGKGRVEGRLYYIEQPMSICVINNPE